MKINYFPGCSLHGTAREYQESIDSVLRVLGIEVEVLPDWNCCGSSSAHQVDETLAVELPGRNLKIARTIGASEIVTPCFSCFNRMRSAAAALSKPGEPFGVETVTLLDVLARPELEEKIRSLVKRPLQGLKLAAYYGCLALRPPGVTGAKDPENPMVMESLVKMLGGVPIDFSYKTDCCGGSHTLTRPEIAIYLVDKIVSMAREAGAEGFVVSCSMCQANLDTRQRVGPGGTKLPVYYFTELMGLAFELPDTRRWLGRHLTESKSLVAGKGILA